MSSDIASGSCLFAIELPGFLGLGDKLWHLSNLHALGSALSYTYVHTPFSCVRSSSTSYVSKRLFEYLRKVPNFRNTQKCRSDYIGKFLGLEKRALNVDDQIFRNYRKTRIFLDEIFRNETFSTLADLKEIINSLDNDEFSIRVFTTEQGIYSYVDRMSHLISIADRESHIEELEISKNYWLLRSKNSIDTGFSPNKIKVLVHIRNGDTASFKIGEKILSIFASSARLIKTEDEILEIGRKPISLEKFSCILEEIFKAYTQESFSVVVVSDGYKRALEVMFYALIRREIALNLFEILTAIKEIYRSEKKLRLFLTCDNCSVIIGESRRNLLRSIHAIADADIVIWSSGGFAYFVHTFLRQSKQPAILLNARSYNLSDLTAIDELLNSRISKISD